MTDHPDVQPVVSIPAGAAIRDAAGWVGTTCWEELRLHQTLTDLLAGPDSDSGADDGSSMRQRWWVVRAHRAELAEAWHRRLPELREFPRAGFVAPNPDGSVVVADGDPVASLRALLDRYRAHVEVAVGPADGPVGETLGDAISRTEADLALLEE